MLSISLASITSVFDEFKIFSCIRTNLIYPNTSQKFHELSLDACLNFLWKRESSVAACMQKIRRSQKMNRWLWVLVTVTFSPKLFWTIKLSNLSKRIPRRSMLSITSSIELSLLTIWTWKESKKIPIGSVIHAGFSDLVESIPKWQIGAFVSSMVGTCPTNLQ